MNALQDVFEQEIPNWRQERFIVAVSGGVDSMVLLYECLQLFEDNPKNHLLVCHINHQIREESNEDAKLVSTFCERYEIPYVIIDWQHGKRIQQAVEEKARLFRYKQFQHVMAKEQISYVLLGHHGDDQVETILMKWTRGTSPEGIAGMRTKRSFYDGFLVRPFLQREKKELYKEANKLGIPYVEDSTNQSTQYTRNRYRHQLIPFLKEENTQVVRHFNEASQWIIDLEEIAQPIIEEHFRKIFVQIGDETWEWNQSLWHQQTNAMRRLLLTQLASKVGHQWSKDNMDLLLESTSQSKAKAQMNRPLAKGWVFQKRYHYYRVTKEDAKPVNQNESYQVFGSEDEVINLSLDEKILVQSSHDQEEGWTVDVPITYFPLTIRRKKTGDKIQFNEKGQHQTLKRWCINEKIPLEEREKLWVMENCQKEIIAILGYRQSQSLSKRRETGKIQVIYQKL